MKKKQFDVTKLGQKKTYRRVCHEEEKANIFGIIVEKVDSR